MVRGDRAAGTVGGVSTSSPGHDAVVVGAGHNGLVAANLLADAGWSVLVLEQQEQVGGAVRSDTEVHPGFVHDTFSAFYPFAAASPVIGRLGLEEHGLRWRHPPAPLGHPFPDGGWALVHPDPEDTADGLEAEHPGDGEAWLDLCRTWDRVGPALMSALLDPFPPVRGGARLLARLPRAGGMHLVRELLTPAASFGAHRFGGRGARTLIAGSAGHADIPLDSVGSGAFGLIMTMLAQSVGFPVPEGGAGRLTEAMARRLESRGGRVLLGTEVSAVEVAGGRAVAVRTREGERYAARRAVVADVSAPLLFGRLVAPEHLPARVVRGMASFELDPATVKVDWALSGPVPWAGAPAVAPGSFHVGDSLAQLQGSLAEVAAGGVPRRPFLLAGQMTTTDPTRSPAGTESLWAYTHVPQSVGATWGRDEVERFGDRVEARLEELAPGFGSRVLARRVLGPRDLQERNASLVGGAVNGGTSQLHQMLVLRPVPGLGRPETGIAGLYLGSSSAHPSGGVHGAPGANAARAALLHHRAQAPLRLGARVRSRLG